jgi:hypothetical protein
LFLQHKPFVVIIQPFRVLVKYKKRTSCDVLFCWLRGGDLNLMVLPNSLRRICLRSPRGTDVNPQSSQFRFGEPRHSPPDCHSLPLRSFASLTTSELFALRPHNPALTRIKSHSTSEKEKVGRCPTFSFCVVLLCGITRIFDPGDAISMEM